MEFEKIPLTMQRFTFKSIMEQCSHYAKQSMNINGMDIESLKKNIICPWELDVIALFGIMNEKKY